MANLHGAWPMAASSCPEAFALLITCEHGGNLIPSSLSHLFAGKEHLLDTHRAYDPGALVLATKIAASLQAPLYYALISRLVIECNRSPASSRLFSPFTRALDQEQKEKLLAAYHRPYHDAIARTAARLSSAGKKLVHVAVHTFTPELHGMVRTADIGLLYDPSRQAEREFCRTWQEKLRQLDTGLRVRRNYPYLGKTDGLPTMLRRKFPDSRYLGIELEVSQKLGSDPENTAAAALISSFTLALAAFSGCKKPHTSR